MPNARRLILTALDWTRPKDPPHSLGHASIWANLLKYGIKVFARSWAINTPEFKADEVIDYAMSHADDNTDFAIGAFVWNETSVQHILKSLKRHRFPGQLIVGGPQVSYVKKDLERFYPYADVFIRGYAEEVMVKLLQQPIGTHAPVIRGVHKAGDPDLGLSAIADFDILPSPFLTGLIPAQRFIRWETQRGCPFECSFCQHRESDVSMKRRQLSKSRIFEEIRWIGAHPEIQDIAVLDPTFNSGNNYLAVLEALAEHEYTGKLALQCRMEMVTEAFLQAVHKLNKTARVILEFGLQTIHREEQLVIRRLNNMTKVSEVLNKSRDMGIETEVSLIFGLPQQTVASFQESVDFCKSMQVQTIHAFPLMLLRGTPLYESKLQYRLIESCDDPNVDNGRVYENIPHVISSPTFTYDDWLIMASIARELETYNETNKQKRITETALTDNPFGLFGRTQSAHRIIATSNDYPFTA